MSDALASLRDIHMPSAISFWPLAPGWYILGTIIVIFLLILLYLNIKNRIKKRALILLKQYQSDFIQNNNANIAASQISQLLKRVALTYYKREEVAGLQGEKWLNFLNITAKNANFTAVKTELLEFPFARNSHGDVKLLFKMANLWIKERKNHV